MSSNEEIIVEIMKKDGCFGQENMIKPDDLVVKCAEKGLNDSEKIQEALFGLIDQDVVEYEMDDDLKTSELWLIAE